MDISTMSKDDLEKLQDELEAEFQLAMQTLTTVELKDLDLSKKIAEIQLERRQLAAALVQGKYNVRRISSDLRRVKPMIYRRLRGE